MSKKLTDQEIEQIGWKIYAQRHDIEKAAHDLHQRVMEEQRAKGVGRTESFPEADRQANEYLARQFKMLRDEYAGDDPRILEYIP